MKRTIGLLLCSLLLAPHGLALKPSDGAPKASRAELSEELSQFVQKGLNEGLFSPAGAGGAPAAGTGEAAAPVAGFDCGQPYSLDFTDLRHISSYQEMQSFVQQSGPDGNSRPKHAEIARAYLAFDLSSEAVLNLRLAGEGEANPLYRLAALLEGRSLPDVAYFREQAACHEPAGLWLALALLADGQVEGAVLLDRHINQFRQLPRHLRDRYAFMAIAALDKQGERVLAEKLLSSFSAEELGNSSQLILAHAILELSRGNTAAEATIRDFLIQGRFQEEALFSLMRNGRQIAPAERELLMSGLLRKVEQSQHDADTHAGLRFVLEELSATSRHQDMIEMAGRTNMQHPAAQDEIRRQLMEGLLRDLASDEPLRNLGAIEALAIESGLLDEAAGREQLYEAAILKAVRLGFGSLADALSHKVHPGDAVNEQRAMLAYQRRKYEAAYQYAEQFPANPQIGLAAALSAIDAGDIPQLRRLESSLSLDAGTVLALIEQDAASGHWIVPDRVYEAAEALTDEAQKRRVDRVTALRDAEIQDMAPVGDVPIFNVSQKLAQSRQVLETLTPEAH